MLRKNILYALLILLPFYLSAQVISPPSSLPNLPNLAVDPVPFEQLITSEAKSAMGMINVYTVKDRYYFEIKDSILDRPILVLNRIVQSSAAVDKSKEGYAGEEMGENTIMFRKGNGKKIFMTSYITNDRSLDSTENGLKRELDLNNTPGILMSFDAKAYGAKKKLDPY
ncbi:DUF5118 domain-containing protein [Flavobacterium sp. CGRL2]